MPMSFQDSPLVGEIAYFVESLDIRENYDYVVTIERKGTALLRRLATEQLMGADVLVPGKVISEEALRYVKGDFFRGKNVLVFDDSVFSGRMLGHVVEEVSRRGAAKVESACLFAHVNCMQNPTRVLYRNLSLPDYAVLREETVRYIAMSDLLILDSEHTPVKVATESSSKEFIKVLTQIDDVMVVPRLTETGDKEYVTIHSPRFFDIQSLSLQPGSQTDGIVLKLRGIIADGYAWLVPLVFPSTPTSTKQEDCPLFRQEPEACICSLASPFNHPNAFYCQSFYASTKLLARTIALLSDLVGRKIEPVEMPFDNLSALFPSMNISAFKKWVKRTIEQELERTSLPPRVHPERSLRLIDDKEGLNEAIDAILHILSDRATEVGMEQYARGSHEFVSPEEFGELNSTIVSGKTRREILDRSRAVDVLVDQAIIAAMPLRSVKAEHGDGYWVRGMRLAGEYVHNLVKQAF